MPAQRAATGAENASLRDVGRSGGGGLVGEDRYSAGANPPFWAQNFSLSSGGARGYQRSSHRDVPYISSPPGGGNLVQCLGLRRARVLWRILPTQGWGPPVGPADRVKVTLLVVTPPAA